MSNKIFSRDGDAAACNIKFYTFVSLMVAALAAALRSVAYFVSFDEDVGYFNESLFPVIINVIIILGCAFALSGYFFISKDARLPQKLDNSSNSVFFASAFAGFILLADFAFKIMSLISNDRFEYYKTVFSASFKSDNAYFIRATVVIEIIGVIASVLSAVCFFVRASKKAKSKVSAWLGFFPIMRSLVGVAEMYFEMEVQMNHPSKLILQFALVAVMLFLLAEQRYFVSEKHIRMRRFFVSGCVAFILAFTGGVSELIGFFSGNLKNGEFCIEAFFCLTVSFYVLARICTFVRTMDDMQREAEFELSEYTDDLPQEEIPEDTAEQVENE